MFQHPSILKCKSSKLFYVGSTCFRQDPLEKSPDPPGFRRENPFEDDDDDKDQSLGMDMGKCLGFAGSGALWWLQAPKELHRCPWCPWHSAHGRGIEPWGKNPISRPEDSPNIHACIIWRVVLSLTLQTWYHVASQQRLKVEVEMDDVFEGTSSPMRVEVRFLCYSRSTGFMGSMQDMEDPTDAKPESAQVKVGPLIKFWDKSCIGFHQYNFLGLHHWAWSGQDFSTCWSKQPGCGF